MIDFTTILKDMEGNELKEDGKVITLGGVAVNALIMDTQESQKEEGAQKLKRWNLAKNIQASIKDKKSLKLDSEDKVLLKNKISPLYHTLIYGQIVDLLEKSE